MSAGRAVHGLDAEMTFAAAARLVVGTRAAEVFALVDGVLDTGAIEHVHDMRVATRRLRAAMELFAPCFPARRHRRALADVKRLAAALGARRDPDVHLAQLTAMAGATAGMATLVEHFRALQADGNERLAAALTAARDSDLEGRLARLAADAR